MPLSAGSRLGPYEVVSAIGAGGMGEVYRATDTRLKRQVAIKILPASLANDRDRLARFQREAEVLASLNHPNIAHIHGLEESDGLKALVMELVNGVTLAELIGSARLPLDQALPIACQIADALEVAHAQGIIHRDLKPANVIVRPDGTVKVLDFGLAKALAPEGASATAGDVANSPTVTSPAMTQMGMILGTAAYMSPEQARGRAVDRRADIWAFGAVLFEMLTGTRAFPGDDVTDTLAAVVRAEPNWTLLPQELSPTLVVFLRRCLEKDPRRRIGDIHDVRLALDGAFEIATAEATASATAPASRTRLAWAVAAVFGLALAGVAVVHFRERPADASRVHLSVPLPETAAPSFFALSPDGRSLAISYQGELGIRSLASGEIRVLTGTPAARTPFWSPDSRMLAFFSDRKLKTVAASGGPPRTLCDGVGIGLGGTWNRADAIVFSTEAGVLARVSASGGACTELTTPELGVRRTIPVFLPDGESFLYALTGTDEARRGLYVASLNDPNGRRLLADRSSALFVPNTPASNQGRLLFVREQALMAQAFDTAARQLSGEPVEVADAVTFMATPPQIAASADTNGTLMYLANGRPDRQLIWYDRFGKELGRAAMTGQGAGVSLTLDGKRVAFGRPDVLFQPSLWMQDLERNQESRLSAPQFATLAAVWSPDGQRVAFRAAGDGAPTMYVKNVPGGAEEVLLPGSASPRDPSDWSRDNRWLVFSQTDSKTGTDIWLLADPSERLTDRKPVPLLQTSANESQGQISPDGRWLAYYSGEAGRGQIYLRPFAGAASTTDRTWQVSTTAGREPRWRADSKELFYLETVLGTGRVKVMSAPIGTGPNPAGAPKPLFEFQAFLTLPHLNVFVYSPAPDGQRFLINVPSKQTEPSLDVILNWGRTPIGQ